MLVPLLHHGMVYVGVPYTEAALNATHSGGTPYGASHVGAVVPEGELSEEEATLARALGRRVATLALKLKR
jgi:NAD(P)H dehydrogenase (quinone)